MTTKKPALPTHHPLGDPPVRRAAPCGTPTFTDPPTPEQIERQIRWEREAIEAGIRRYREEQNDPSRTLADTSPGQRIIREIMREFVPFLADAQGAIKAGLLEPGRASDWMFLILLLPADVLAFLTIRAVMVTATTPRDGNDLKRPTLLKCIRTLIPSIETEVAFRSWVDEERANKRRARELGQPYRDLYEALRRSVKTVNARTFRRWMNRIGRLWEQGWPDEERVHLGAELIGHMLECSSDYFTLDLRYYSGKWHNHVALTEKACALIKDQHARAEIMRPLKRPMLVPPRPWRWKAAEPEPDTDDHS